MIWVYIFIFIVACFALAFSGKWMISALSKIARFLGWREFVVAFILISLGTSIPNLFVGISAALHRIPELSFGDVVGGNVVDLTLAVALATIIAGGIHVESRTVQSSSFFTLGIAILPLLLVLDGNLSRLDGMILILAFFFYIWWLFSKQERFTRIYDHRPPNEESQRGIKNFLKNFGVLLGGLALLVVSAEAIVRLASYFSESMNTSIASIGLLIVALGNCLPEIYFSILSAKAGQTWMIMGNLMGSVIICATLVLGIVVLICPIQGIDFSPFAAARFFLVISSVFFLIFLRTDRMLSKKEAIFLLMIYFSFIITEVLLR